MLQAAGHQVVGLDNDLFEECVFYEPLPTVPYIKKDVRDVEGRDLAGFEAVIHLAGLSNEPLGRYNPAITYSINYAASVNIARQAKAVGVQRFLFASTCSIYGDHGDVLITEGAEPRPKTPYGLSKMQAEEGIKILADRSFSPTFLRCATVYGISPKIRFDLVLNNLVAWAHTTGTIFLKSDGTPWRPIIHVEDVAQAYVALINAPRDLVHGHVFNVGITKENYQVRELAKIVNDAVPNSNIEYADNAGPGISYKVDCSKFTKAISEYAPQWDARKGAEQLYTTYKRVGLLSTDEFEGPRYRRIRHLEKLISSGSLNSSLRWRRRINE